MLLKISLTFVPFLEVENIANTIMQMEFILAVPG